MPLEDITGNWFLSWAPPDAYWIQYFNQPWTKEDWENLPPIRPHVPPRPPGPPQSSRLRVKFVDRSSPPDDWLRDCEEYIGYYGANGGDVYISGRAKFRVRIFRSGLDPLFYLSNAYTLSRPGETPVYKQQNTGPVVSMDYHYKIYDPNTDTYKYKHEAWAGFLREDESRGRFMYGFMYAINDNSTAVWMMSDRENWL